MTELTPAQAYSRAVEIRTEGALPRSLTLAASESERERLARWLGIPAVDRLEAQVTLEAWRVRGVRVSGSLEADVVQLCVATGEPMVNLIQEGFERYFQPQLQPPPKALRREVEVKLEEIDIERLESGKIDVGAIVAEELSLALDPHPRLPDALIDPGAEANSGQDRENPFAVLAALKVKDRPEETG